MTEAKRIMLSPGTYRLTGPDLPPLFKDKRKTSDWRFCPIKSGKLFFYTEWTYSPCDDNRPITERRIYPVGCYSHESVRPDESLWTKQLAEALESVQETPTLWLRREHSWNFGATILDELVASGKLTMENVMRTAAEHDERMRAEEAVKKGK